MIYSQDRNAIKWLKKDLGELVNEATAKLGVYVDNDYQGDYPEQIAAILHKLLGTFRMVQLSGATMLVEEMEEVAGSLMDAPKIARRDRSEALMLALVHLPDYLDHLEKGAPDMPFSVLSNINDLRASREAPLVSETAFFAPHIKDMLADAGTAAANPKFGLITKQLRTHFHKGLLSWYKKHEPAKSLNLIRQVFLRLYQASGTDSAKRFWEAAQAMIAGLEQELIEPTISVKLLIGHLDRSIKLVMEKGEEALASEMSLALLKNLLFYLAATESDNEVINRVRQKYQLENTIAVMSDADSHQGLVDENLLMAVRTALLEDIARIKDNIELYMRGDRTDLTELEELNGIFTKLSDTFGMLGQDAHRDRVRGHAEFIETHVADNRPPSDNDLMKIAEDLVTVEASLNNLQRLSGQSAGQTSARQDDLNAHMQVALGEAHIEIKSIKELIETFYESPEMQTALDDLPVRFDRIAGMFQIIELERAAGVVKTLKRLIAERLFAEGLPAEEKLNLLADVITGVEYYIEGLLENSDDVQSSIDATDKDLQILLEMSGGPLPEADVTEEAEPLAETEPALTDDYLPETDAVAAPESLELELPAEDIAETLSEETFETEAGDHLDGLELVLDIDESSESVPDMTLPADEPVIDDSQDSASAVTDLPEEAEALSLDEMSFEPADAQMPTSADSAADEALLDVSDLVLPETESVASEPEAFVEPADGITELAEAETVDAETPDAGLDLSELQLEPEDESQAVVSPDDEQPLSLETDESRVAEETDHSEDEAPDVVISMDDLTLSEESFDTGEASDPRVKQAPVSELQSDIDSEILEIFAEEAYEEIGVIQAEYPKWRADHDNNAALQRFRRSFHTLKGSGRLVGANLIGEFAWAIENMLNRVIDGTITVSPQLLNLMNQVVEHLPGLLESQKANAPATFDIDTLQSLAEQLAAGELPEALNVTVDAAQTDEPRAQEAGSSSGSEVLTTGQQADEEPEPLELEVPQQEETEEVADGITLEPELLEIFSAESDTHLQTIRAFLSEAHADGREEAGVTEPLVRAFHTLRGSANMAEVFAVAEVATVMEKQLLKRQEQNTALGLVEQAALEEAADLMVGIIHTINRPGFALPDWQAFVNRQQQLLDSAPAEPVAPAVVDENLDNMERFSLDEFASEASLESDFSLEPEQDDEVLSLDGLELDEDEQAAISSSLPGISRSDETSESVETVEPAVEPDIIEPELDSAAQDTFTAEPEPEPEPESADEPDQEMVEIFLEEAAELQEAMDTAMQAWAEDPDSLSQIPQLHRTLHTMKGGARMAGIAALGDLSHAMESLLSAIDNGLIHTTPDIFALAQRTADHIGTQIDDLQSGNGVNVDRDLIEELQQTAKTGQVSRPSPAANQAEPVSAEPSTPQAAVPEPASDDFGLAPEVPEIRTREEYEKLPSGCLFKAPDGSIRVKP